MAKRPPAEVALFPGHVRFASLCLDFVGQAIKKQSYLRVCRFGRYATAVDNPLLDFCEKF
jgi:hypothetical protein